MTDRAQKRRLTLLCVAFPAVFFSLFSRLVYVQFFHPRDFAGRAENQSKLVVKIPPYRGKILDRVGRELALDIQLDSLGARSREVRDPESLARKLQPILGVELRFLLERLRRPKNFVWIARKISPAQSLAIRALKRPELELRKEWKRTYPNRETGSHVVGFTGLDHEGLEGIELVFDSYLKGVPGWKLTQKDAKQRELVSYESGLVLPVNGYDVHLSVDLVIQHLADKFLDETCRKYRALGGSLTVMDPRTGDILALANFPNYDPNDLNASKSGDVRNRAITDIYEPGSVFKIITLSAVLEEKRAALTDVFYCENGSFRTGGRVLHDVHPYGNLTLEDVIAKSSNIGTVKAAMRLGGPKLHECIKKFGFGERTEIPLPGESPGLLTNPRNWSATSMSSVPIGQEVGLTALQLASAVSAIASGGVLMKPRLVTRLADSEGQTVRENPPVPRRRVISEATARDVQRAMRKAVAPGGTGKLADIPGSEVGGKTETSQKIDAEGRYSHSDFISSFAGFIRKGDRLVTITVSIDNPKPVYYGGVVAAPLFAKLGQGILDYWQLGENPRLSASSKKKKSSV